MFSTITTITHSSDISNRQNTGYNQDLQKIERGSGTVSETQLTWHSMNRMKTEWLMVCYLATPAMCPILLNYFSYALTVAGTQRTDFQSGNSVSHSNNFSFMLLILIHYIFRSRQSHTMRQTLKNCN